MSPVSRATTAGRVYLDLQRLARQTKRPTDELLRTYVLERFLWRVANSDYRDQLILKGGLLLAAFGERRPTADVDLLARGVSNDLETVSAMVAAILVVDSDDGVTYATDQISVTAIREDDLYPGVRVSVPANIDRARAVLRVDVNIGDPVTPAPIAVQYPGLLHAPFDIVGYPFETVLAEKIVTMLDRGILTTRERDFADVYLLSGRLVIEGAVLAEAVEATMVHRGSRHRSLIEALGDLGQRRQASWRAFVNNAGLGDSLPASFEETIEAVVGFAQPVIDGDAAGQEWDPSARNWVANVSEGE